MVKESAKLPVNEAIVFFDGQCQFCSSWIRLLLFADTRHRLFFSPLQGTTACKYLPPEMIEKNDSLVFAHKGALFIGARGVSSIASLLPFPWRLLWLFQWVPLSESLYRWVASRRHRISGSQERCPFPADGVRFLP